MLIEKDKRIDGEYDPPYNFNSNPSDDDKKKAQEVIDKYNKLAVKKNPDE